MVSSRTLLIYCQLAACTIQVVTKLLNCWTPGGIQKGPMK